MKQLLYAPVALLCVAASLLGQQGQVGGGITQPGNVQFSATDPTGNSCIVGQSPSITYTIPNPPIDFVCGNGAIGSAGVYVAKGNGAVTTLAASGVGASGAAGANKLTGPANTFAHLDSSGNGEGLTPAQTNTALGTVTTTATTNQVISGPLQPSNSAVDPKQYGAKGDNSTDDTTSINSAFSACSGGMVRFSPGTYLISSDILVPVTCRVWGDSGSQIKASAAITSVLDFGTTTTPPANTSVGGFLVINANNLANYGIYVHSTNNFKIDSVTVLSPLVNGIHLGDPSATTGVFGAYITNSIMLIPSGTAYQSGSAGIYVESVASDFHVINNLCIGFQEGIINHGGGGFLAYNHVWSFPSNGPVTISFDDYSSSTFWDHNISDSASTYGLRIRNAGIPVITNNRFYLNSSATDNVTDAIHFDQANPAGIVTGNAFQGQTSSNRFAKDLDFTGNLNSLTYLQNQTLNVVTIQQPNYGIAGLTNFALKANLNVDFIQPYSNSFNSGNISLGTGTGVIAERNAADAVTAVTSFQQSASSTGHIHDFKNSAGVASFVAQNGAHSAPIYLTSTNCSSAASPAVCGSAAAGKVQIAAAATTLTINSTAFSGNSECSFTYSTVGITAPTNLTSLGPITETAQTATTSLAISIPVAPLTNPVNIKYSCVN